MLIRFTKTIEYYPRGALSDGLVHIEEGATVKSQDIPDWLLVRATKEGWLELAEELPTPK